ncbi:MAG: DUF692 domain-containing protein [Planctomycetaceae bacterium]|nr:DUF692 domain-containing protein [Planctomycetaceae bacterium]
MMQSGHLPRRAALPIPRIGLAVREENRDVLTAPAVGAVEITFERADDPLRMESYLNPDDFEYVSVHSLKLSIASADRPRRDYLDALRSVIDENRADAMSDHLGFTRHGNDGVEIGHFAPPPCTLGALDATCRNVEFLQSRFAPLPFFVENIAYTFQFPGTMTEAEFLCSLFRRTGCGWLLDVTNVYANSVNFGFDARQFIADVMPAARRLQIHLAGGFWSEKAGRYIDSHSDPIPAEVWDLYEFALKEGRGKIDAVFIERDQNFPDDQGWLDELAKARAYAGGA